MNTFSLRDTQKTTDSRAGFMPRDFIIYASKLFPFPDTLTTQWGVPGNWNEELTRSSSRAINLPILGCMEATQTYGREHCTTSNAQCWLLASNATSLYCGHWENCRMMEETRGLGAGAGKINDHMNEHTYQKESHFGVSFWFVRVSLPLRDRPARLAVTCNAAATQQASTACLR